MIKVALSGACGRMGARIAALLADGHDMKLAVAIEREGHPDLGKPYGPLVGLQRINLPLVDHLDQFVHVLIDFASPASTLKRLDECAKRGSAIVIGTTGHSPEQLKRIRAAAAKIPVLLAPNMSIGVNLLFRIAAEVARRLGDSYDIEIVEAHHRFKKDSPSGTALRLAQGIAEALGRDLNKVAAHGRAQGHHERPSQEIGIHAVRAGDIIGEHTVLFSNLGERIELTHRAHSRDTFAGGAVRAARFLASAKPGNYSIDQAFGLTENSPPTATSTRRGRTPRRIAR